jgi:hypothetical protein
MLLGGCPAIEPIIPDPAPPTPTSGVWGLHIADVTADGFCGELGAEAIGRVIRMDVAAEDRGELALSIFGLDLYGGHADGQAWADAELSGYWGWGYDEPVVVYEDQDDQDLMGDDGGSGNAEEDRGEPEEGEVSTPSCGEGTSEEPREAHCDTPYMAPGLFVAFDADVINARTMDGFIQLTVSDGYDACTFEAEVNAAYLGEDVDFDLIGDPEPPSSTSTDPGYPLEASTKPSE